MEEELHFIFKLLGTMLLVLVHFPPLTLQVLAINQTGDAFFFTSQILHAIFITLAAASLRYTYGRNLAWNNLQ